MNDLYHLQKYTMLLGAIYYAGRYDGYSECMHSYFNSLNHLFRCNEYKITHLAQQIKEKCDGNWVKYLLYFNDDQPQFCYLRHLLVFIHCTRTKDGHVFTTADRLSNLDNTVDNEFTKPLDYHAFFNWPNEVPQSI